MAYVVTQPCVGVKDQACVQECPVDCIYLGDSMVYIHPDECVDCGACEPVCPVEAIYYEDDVPAEWENYISANVDFFAGLGSPGGASRIGPQPFDAPQVSTNRNLLVQSPKNEERSTADLFGILCGGPAGYALAVQRIGSDRGLGTAMRLLFDGVASIVEQPDSTAARVAFDDTVLPRDQTSMSALLHGVREMFATAQGRHLDPVPLETVRRAVIHRAMAECAGRPILDVPHLYDMRASNVAANLAPLLLCQALRRSGADVHAVTTSFSSFPISPTSLLTP